MSTFSQVAAAAAELVERNLPDALALLGAVSAPQFIRVHPVDSTEAFVIAPHSALGAIALRFFKANDGDASTPSSSVGTPFGGWRLAGIRRLVNVEADPLAGYMQFVSNDIGSQQFAIRLAATYAGVYHGGLTHNSQIFTSMADLTVAAYISAFVFYSTFTLDWGGGNTMTGNEKITLFPDGHIETATYIAGGLEFDPVYLDMTIFDNMFDRGRAVGDANWTKLLSNVDGVSDIDYAFSGADAVQLRDRASGIIATVTDDSRASARFDSKWLRRSPLGGSMRSKLYAKLKSAVGVVFPATTVRRSIVFSKDAPDAFSWTASADGFDGVSKASGIGFPANTGSAFRYTRSATLQYRAKWRVGVEPGGTYRVPVATALAGGGATSGSNGMTYAVTYDAIDSIQTPTPILSRSYTQVTTDGYLEFTVPAGVYVVQIIIQMTTGTAGHLVDVSSLGPIVRTA